MTDPNVAAWLQGQGGWGVTVAVLFTVIAILWKGREKLLDKREDDVRVQLTALTASTKAQEELADAVRDMQVAIVEFSKLAAVRAEAFDSHARRFDEFVRRFDEFARRADAAFQQRATP